MAWELKQIGCGLAEHPFPVFVTPAGSRGCFEERRWGSIEQPHLSAYQWPNKASGDPKLPVVPVGSFLVHAMEENEGAGTAQAVELAGKHPDPLMIVEGVQDRK